MWIIWLKVIWYMLIIFKNKGYKKFNIVCFILWVVNWNVYLIIFEIKNKYLINKFGLKFKWFLLIKKKIIF